jgi:hypothetical protein
VSHAPLAPVKYIAIRNDIRENNFQEAQKVFCKVRALLDFVAPDFSTLLYDGSGYLNFWKIVGTAPDCPSHNSNTRHRCCCGRNSCRGRWSLLRKLNRSYNINQVFRYWQALNSYVEFATVDTTFCPSIIS